MLEQRHLLASGPSLVAVLPDVPVGLDEGQFLRDNDFLNEAPRELVLQFSPGEVIDVATVAPGIQLTRAGLDAAFSPASVASDFNTNGAVVLEFTSARLGETGNGVSVVLTGSDHGKEDLPTVRVVAGRVTIDLNTRVGDESTAQDLLDALAASRDARNLLTAGVTTAIGSENTDITPAVRRAASTAVFGAPVNINMQLTASVAGESGNGIIVSFTENDRGGAGPGVTVSGNTVTVDIDSLGTTAKDVRDAINTQASSLIQASVDVADEDVVVSGFVPTAAPANVVLGGAKNVSPLVLNGAAAASGSSDFGTGGSIGITFTAANAGGSGNGIAVVTT
ncbi:MAG: hypothetical protein ACC645_00475, partial [Pirellulales bacterium]